MQPIGRGSMNILVKREITDVSPSKIKRAYKSHADIVSYTNNLLCKGLFSIAYRWLKASTSNSEIF